MQRLVQFAAKKERPRQSHPGSHSARTEPLVLNRTETSALLRDQTCLLDGRARSLVGLMQDCQPATLPGGGDVLGPIVDIEQFIFAAASCPLHNLIEGWIGFHGPMFE